MGGTPPTSNEDIQSHPIGAKIRAFRIASRSKKKIRREGGKEGKREEGKGRREGKKGRGEKAVYMTGVGLVVFRFKSPPGGKIVRVKKET